MSYWLFKSEPSSYSIDDLQQEENQTTCWDGVRNYQARNFMRDDMKVGDRAFFYHSNGKTPGIVGIVDIVRSSYIDTTAFDPEDHHYDPKSTPNNPRWLMVDVRFRQRFSIITLSSLKQHPLLTSMLILRKGNRLSITPVSKTHWDVIISLVNCDHNS